MKQFKLSVVTINFNNKSGLINTFESINNQSWQEFEYIVIDGYSSDGEKELIQKNERINYWVSEKDNGVYSAMNKAIKVANGEYVIFMNSGDIFFDNDVLIKAEKYFKDGTGILYGNTFCVKNNIHIKDEIPPNKLSFNFFYNAGLIHQSCFIKRDLFEKTFFYNELYKICSDWEFFIYAICAKNESYLYIDEFISIYDLSGISSDPRNLELYFSERELTFEKYFPAMIDDYRDLKQLDDKRIRNMIYIKNFNIPWKILKGLSKVLLLFIPKQKNRSL
jgi:glycosyltransferase involved in cell wall biosynthesis